MAPVKNNFYGLAATKRKYKYNHTYWVFNQITLIISKTNRKRFKKTFLFCNLPYKIL